MPKGITILWSEWLNFNSGLIPRDKNMQEGGEEGRKTDPEVK